MSEDPWTAAEQRAANRDSDLGFFKDHEAKAAYAENMAKMAEEARKAEEARYETEKLKRGGAVPNNDAEFEFRKPRDVLRIVVPPAFAFDDVPPSIGRFAYFHSQAMGHDQSAVIVAAVTAAASVIDDGFKLTVRPESNWTVSARQWSFLCGRASAGKSPSIRAATDPIKNMHDILYSNWRVANDGVRRDEKEPVPALYTSDTTIAALSVCLGDNPRGILMLTEEFSSWIGAIDAADKGEASKNRGDWLQLRDGGGRQINRIERGSVYVPNWGVSVLAACTPDGLAKQMKYMPEDGLIQRFIPCIMGAPNLDAKGDARPALVEWKNWLEWAYTTTDCSYPRYLTLSAAAKALFDVEEREIRQLVMATEEFSPAYAAHLGKHPGMLAELALVFHVFSAAQGGPSNEVGAEAVQYAIKYLRKARRHAHTLYSDILSSAPAFELARALARSIVASEEPVTTISRDWMTQHCQMFKKADDRLRREAVQILEDADWLSAQTQLKYYAGWPRGYLVNPQVFQIFAREGEQWRARRAAVKDAIGESG